MNTLEIKNLHVSIDNKPILKGVDLVVNEKEVHFYQCEEFTLKTKELAPLSIDGEVATEKYLHVKMIKQQLRMRVPQHSSLQ